MMAAGLPEYFYEICLFTNVQWFVQFVLHCRCIYNDELSEKQTCANNFQIEPQITLLLTNTA